ncbi:NIF family HAD-type phosphatase [Mariprofundus aestuarium]
MLGQTTLIDNSSSILERHYESLVQIKRFKGYPDDQELFKLMR